MKNKLENDNKKGKLNKLNKLNILKALKRILLDEDNGINEIPGLNEIQPTSHEEEELIDELKKSQKNIDNRFKDILKVKPYKLKENNNKEGKSVKKENNKVKKENERVD